MAKLDYPFDEVTAEAEKLVAQGAMVHQKFTCQHCRVRQTMEEPNTFYTSGRCEECGGITDIKARGCNYLLIKKLG